MPIILPPITRRQFVKRSLALGGTAMMTSRAFAAADSERAGLDQNRVALLADNAQNPKKNLGVIDHILYNNLSGTQASDGGIIEFKKPLSDHKPIWAEIVFPRELDKVKKLQ